MFFEYRHWLRPRQGFLLWLCFLQLRNLTAVPHTDLVLLLGSYFLQHPDMRFQYLVARHIVQRLLVRL